MSTRAQPACDPVRATTLIELLAVLAIISLLAAAVLGVGHHATESGRVARARAEMAALFSALENYRREYGDYPQTNDAAVLLQSLIGRRGPTGQVISARVFVDVAHLRTADSLDPFADSSAQCIDPWERPYAYAYKSPLPWSNPSFVLYSNGPDGAAAGLLSGGFVDDAAPANEDNVYWDR